jgi:single-stranded-DNA-specific exonuclease
MGIAEKAIELLTTEDSDRASRIAAELEEANDRRRALEQETLAEVLALPELRNFEGNRGICIGRVGWHVGVIGIVAARLVDRFGVPSLVAGLNGNEGRCSARSPAGLNLKEMLDDCSEHLEAHGGHALAAGATVTEAKFQKFKQAFEEVSARRMRENRAKVRIHIDERIPFSMIRPEFVAELALLQPHGAGNPPPQFLTEGVQVVGKPQVLGQKRKAVAVHLRQGDRTFRSVSFGGDAFLEQLKATGPVLDVAYRLKFNDYFQPGNIELEIEDIRRAEL